jgi:hypothetical protein
MNYVFVHGIDQEKQSSKKLEAEWLKALNEGLGGAANLETAIVPFYGHTLAHWTDPDRYPRSGPIDDFARFVKAFKSEALQKAPAQARAAGLHRRDHDNLNRDWFNNPIVVRGTQMIDRGAPFLSAFFISKVLRTVHTYLRSAKARREIDQTVQKVIAEAEGPTTVVGHSLGSVVAYNVLRNNWDSKVERFITLGSPLAINAVYARLPDYKNLGPFGIKDWFNAFDPQDIVALNPLQNDHFGSSLKVENVSVVNDTPNHHGISGYFKNPQIARRTVGLEPRSGA